MNTQTAMKAANANRKGRVCQIAQRKPYTNGDIYGLLVGVATAANAIERKKVKIGIEMRMMPKKTIGPL
jgi:hypothetical protein